MKPEQFEKRMKDAAREVSRPRKVLQDAALIVEGNAKRRSPVRTGNLRRSITNRVEDTEAFVGTNVEYAPYVHYGTRYSPAQPFLEEGLEDSRSEIEAMMERFGDAVFKKVGK